MILASLKYGVEDMRMKILKYFRVLKTFDGLSLAMIKCSKF